MGEARHSDPSDELDRFVEAYEAAQLRDGSADLASFLPDAAHPLYREVLCELVRVELEYAWARNQRPSLEEYLQRFPQLVEDDESLGAILFEEYRLRRQADENPSPEEYHKRFGVDVQDWIDRLPSPSNDRRISFETRRTPVVRPLAAASSLIPADNVVVSRSSSEEVSLPEVGAVFLGFQLLAELGRGSFGRVYLARQGELADRPVALKLSVETLGEPQVLAQLQHTNIVPIYSIHRAPPFHAVCMPFLGSVTLADVLRQLRGEGALPASGMTLVAAMNVCKSKILPMDRGSPNPPRDFAVCLKTLEGLSYVNAIVWIGARLADGLAHAHERGILHRDLKPANILLGDDGQPMLLDFNLSEDTKLRSRSPAAFIGGTLPYMAPEHLAAFEQRGQRLDIRSDVYALGVILFELLTYQCPYPLPNLPAEAMLPQMIEDRLRMPPRLRAHHPAISPAVEAIIRRCLHPHPEQRYPSARQLQEDLERHLKDLPLYHTSEPSLRERLRKWSRRHPRLTTFTSVASLAVAVVLSLGVLFILRGERLARLETAESFQRFVAEVREAQTLFLEARAAGADRLEEIVAACQRPLAHYDISVNFAWQETPAFRYLSPDEQARLRAEVGELLFLQAALARLEIHPDLEAQRREVVLRRAWELNVQAESCYENNDVPSALWRQRAMLAQLLGREGEARRLFARAAETPPRGTRDRCMLACFYMVLGRFRQALPLWQQASREAPQNVWVWYGLGSCYDDLNDRTQALSCYTACIALHPDFHAWYFKRGLAHLRLGQHVQAAADFDRAVGLRPDHTDSLVNRALARLGVGQPAEAIADLSHALELGVGNIRIYLMRAQAREQAGDIIGAVADRNEANKREPTDDEGWVARGVGRAEKQPRSALTDFDRALAINPRSLPALESKAHVLAEKLGRTADALQVLDRAVAFHPESSSLRAARAVLMARLGQGEAARKEAQEALSLDSSPAIVYQVAGAYALTSRQSPADRQQALALLSSALRRGYGHQLLEADRDLDALRENPRFHQLLQATRALRREAPQPTG